LRVLFPSIWCDRSALTCLSCGLCIEPSQYYHDATTGETTWDKPDDFVEPGADVSAAADAAVPEVAAAAVVVNSSPTGTDIRISVVDPPPPFDPSALLPDGSPMAGNTPQAGNTPRADAAAAVASTTVPITQSGSTLSLPLAPPDGSPPPASPAGSQEAAPWKGPAAYDRVLDVVGVVMNIA